MISVRNTYRELSGSQVLHYMVQNHLLRWRVENLMCGIYNYVFIIKATFAYHLIKNIMSYSF